MLSPLTIDTHFIRAPLRRAVERGLDSQALLRELGISDDVFEQKNTLVHVDQYVALVKKVWAFTDDEHSGLSGTPCKPGQFALMVRYAMQYDTLGKIAYECCRFYNTTRYDIALTVVQEDQRTGFVVTVSDPEYDPDHYLLEFLMVGMHRFFSWLIGLSIPLLETQFAYSEPEHVKAYATLFPGKRSFNCEHNAFYFATEHLKRPKIRSWTETRDFLRDAPATLMVAPNSDNSYTARIKTILLQVLGKETSIPDFDNVARQLNVSSQTLRRKLRSEQSSYQQIKDQMRRDIAIDKLVREDISISDIALRLGFVESSSFTRAFKQWTGVSPAEYRSRREH
jgi:AraC-like DNA-binding protein